MKTDPRPVLALCLPCQDSVKTEFALSLLAVGAYTNDFRLVVIRGSSSIVTAARDMCVERLETTEEMIKQKIEWTMWFDSDIEFPPQTIARLVAHKRDIVGAAYCRRSAPYDMMVKTLKNKPVPRHGVVEVEGLPLGCMLIRRSVFASIRRLRPPPYFYLTFDNGRCESEDLVFCREARDMGYSVWCDVDLSAEIGHVGSFTFRADRPLSEQQVVSDAA
jgi:hypothetical protein